MMPEASESRQAEGGAPKSLLLRHYLESKTLVALRLDAELYGLTRTGTKKQVVERLLAEDALLSAPAIPWASEQRGDLGLDVEQTEDDSEVEDEPVEPGAPQGFALELPTGVPAGSVEEAALVFEEQWQKARNGERGSKRLAERFAENPLLRDGAVLALKRRIFAPGSWRTHRSRVRTSLRVLAKAGHPDPFPLSIRAAEVLFGVLKAAKYRSAATYVNAVRVEAFLRGFPADPELLEWCRRLSRAAARGRGQPKHSEPITAQLLERLVEVCLEEVRAATSEAEAADALARADAYVLAWTFGLRVDEVVTFDAEESRVWVGHDEHAVALNISMSKTNPERKDTWRTAGCSCSAQGRSAAARERRAHTCAVHRLEDRVLRGDSGVGVPLVGKSRTRGCNAGEPRRWRKAELLRALRADLAKAEVRVRDPEGAERYGMHAFRRGAAQAMARAGWSESTIKAYLRWESGCVALYIAEAPLALSRGFAASLWGAPGRAFCQPGVQGSLANMDGVIQKKELAKGRKRERKAARAEEAAEEVPGPEESAEEYLAPEQAQAESPPRARSWLDCDDAFDAVESALAHASAEASDEAEAGGEMPPDGWKAWREERRDEELLRNFGRLESAKDAARFSTRWWGASRHAPAFRRKSKGCRHRWPTVEDLGQAGVEWRDEQQARAQRWSSVLDLGAPQGAPPGAGYSAPDPLLVSSRDRLLALKADPLLGPAQRDPLTGEVRKL